MLVIVGIMVKNDEDSRGNLKQKSKEVVSFPLEMDVLWTLKLHFQTSCLSPELCSAARAADSWSRLLAQPQPNYSIPRHDSHSRASRFTYTCKDPLYQAGPEFPIISTKSLFSVTQSARNTPDKFITNNLLNPHLAEVVSIFATDNLQNNTNVWFKVFL